LELVTGENIRIAKLNKHDGAEIRIAKINQHDGPKMMLINNIKGKIVRQR